MRKHIWALIILFCFFTLPANADEGMWLPWFLPQSQLDKMQEMGFELSSEEIYSTSRPSLKDAIVSLDDGSCTGSFISKKGLILTNHHCANGDIQKHSSVETDRLKNGFWAQSSGEEIPNPGKTATLLVDVQDLTTIFSPVLKNASTRMELEMKIDSLSGLILDTLSLAPSHEAEIKDFSFRNRFFLIVTKTYRDVRLVAAPPEDIAQFGGEKDNWKWPRHSADFALYRIYCSPEGESADYHPENIPYTPKKSLEISTNGVEENDFALTLGYPGNTQRYITAEGISETYKIINPLITEISGFKQKIWEEQMPRSRQTEIMYSEKYASLMNFSQYTSGQNKSISKLNLIEERRRLEDTIQQWIMQSPKTEENYASLLSSMETLYQMRGNLTHTSFLTFETILSGTETGQFVLKTFELFSLINEETSSAEKKDDLIKQMKEKADHHYDNFSPTLDREVFLSLMNYYRTNAPDSIRINDSTLLGTFNNFEQLADAIYTRSYFSSRTRFEELMNNPQLMNFLTDPAFDFYLRVLQEFGPVYSMFIRIDRQIDFSMHRYFKLLKMKDPERNFYPDANSSMRLSYGTVKGYSPRDGIYYQPFTSQKGIFGKIRSQKPEYQSAINFKELFETDGRNWYASEQETTLCFITNNDISGGNSGSPVLNAGGQLVGLAFDGNLEGMASDLSYSEKFQRCINVDIRYILFLIDKMGQSPHLLKEMNII
ncbi:S46 family peptidase [Marinilabilia sp.]|uniref:S46 family peptidase n=1 Tax=Marinilabilia sp. TaxID=2021252 RepID=UPI0025BBFF32|nr:S46 family peptidase [Marinilabilia sp.]